MMKWTLFLDRDGVINDRVWGGYVRSVEEFNFLPRVLEAIALLSNSFERIFVVTNQQGVAKGLMGERNLSDIHRFMCDEIEKTGGKITACYAAMELKSDPASTRKPLPAMALQAQKDFPEVDFQYAVMVGDTDSDILFGKNLGMKTVRVKTEEPIGVEADHTVNDLYEFAILWQQNTSH
ncbi:MAG: hypothetical protein K0R65_2191 [Crocinitomicaceae bacterium]|jgi:histidinol-phosphate phosphatase family protein|nr:hypothetical protein [Crocinitomicaceae bacterium]